MKALDIDTYKCPDRDDLYQMAMTLFPKGQPGAGVTFFSRPMSAETIDRAFNDVGVALLHIRDADSLEYNVRVPDDDE